MEDIAKRISQVDVSRQIGESKLKSFLDRLETDQDRFKHDFAVYKV
jgi:hypothetical protein